ncbi:MAG: hypothetical protein JSW45_04280 [Thiotrichales bacterium]|nr:MAG: hypothetical protein JSW45_04280 [Thiotrichales bacterium]
MAESNLEFINEIPDFTQSNIRGWQYRYGAEFCAPVAVSNSLSWMAGMTDNQASLAILLASGRYMNTDVWKGTSMSSMLSGIHAIAVDLFGGYKNLGYQGWKRHPHRFSTGKRIPDIEWVKDGIGKDSAVWLNVGWYRYDSNNDSYHRVGGHWVTLVGYDSDVLVLHDPSPRAGRIFANEYVRTSVIGHGVMIDRTTAYVRPAKGFLQLGEGMHIKSIADVAIVDGAIVFRR